MNNDTLTVAIPNYNHGRFIAEALSSVLSQNVQPSEVIVIDDASTDDSVGVIETFMRDHRNVRLIRNETNKGVFYGVNRALNEATGEFFYVLAADDKVLPGFFERTTMLLKKHPEAGLCSVALRLLNPEGAQISRDDFPAHYTHAAHARSTPPFLSPVDVLKRLDSQPWFLGGVAGLMFRRAAFAEAGGLKGELGLFADWFAPHYVALKYGMCYHPTPLAAFRIMPNSYGTSIVLRPRASLENAVNTLRMMRAPAFASVFPAWFVERKKREFSYGCFRGALVNWQTGFLRDVRELVPAATWLDRIMLVLLRSARNFQWLIMKAYCCDKVALPLRRE